MKKIKPIIVWAIVVDLNIFASLAGGRAFIFRTKNDAEYYRDSEVIPFKTKIVKVKITSVK